jgi:hypothetical protein
MTTAWLQINDDRFGAVTPTPQREICCSDDLERQHVMAMVRPGFPQLLPTSPRSHPGPAEIP